jgi:glycosyltransferase involved in cell wall biosynthesis
MTKITVLTAIYNSEKYLSKCLDSLCEQTLKDIQIICIDDCSTDSSPNILKEYAERDNRIVCIRMEQNSGQAIARNKGLEIADGEYITMLDSDDWLAPDSLEKAYMSLKKNNEFECAVFRLLQYYEDTGNIIPFINRTQKNVLNGEEAFKLSLDWKLHGLYVIKADIHKSYPYDTSCRLFSDDNTTRLHYLHSNKVVFCDGEYIYRKHTESMTNACSILRFDYMEANLSMKNTLIAEIAEGNITNPEDILDFYEEHRWLNLVGMYWYYYKHKEQFNESECAIIEKRIASMLKTIEKKRIAPSTKYKLGYYPFKSYKTFRFVANFYFGLRNILWKLKVL